MPSGFEQGLLSAAEQTNLRRDRLHLLQMILRGVDRRSPLTHACSPVRTLVVSVSRAEIVLRGHHDRKQPRKKLLEAVCGPASEAIRTAQHELGGHPCLTAADAALGRVATSPDGTFRAACGTAATELERLKPDLERVVTDALKQAWNGPEMRVPSDSAYYIAREAAALVLAAGRASTDLAEDVQRFVACHGHDTRALLDAMMPAPRPYRVACVIDGADHLRGLDMFLPGVRQFALGTDRPTGWDDATDRLRSFAEQASQVSRSLSRRAVACLVTLDIAALDRGAAAELAYRRIGETLDQYVAGHRLVDLRIRPDVLVGVRPGSRAGVRSQLGHAVEVALPLTTSWPGSLRESMRMAHIARTTASPTASTGLAWVALEAAGLDFADRTHLAGALAVQTLRHQLVQAHQDFRDGVTALRKSRKHDVRRAAEVARRLAGGLSRIPQDSPAAPALTMRHEAAVEDLRAAEALLGAYDREVSTRLAIVEDYVEVGEAGQLVDLNSIVDLLRPALTSDTDSLAAARDGLLAILDHLPPLAAAAILRWQARLAAPETLAQWLVDRTTLYEELIDWLYATRNLALHSGRHQLAGDWVLAVTAAGVVDLFLEMLGHWYEIAASHAPENRDLSPEEVAGQLATRCVDTQQQARTTDWSGFNAAHLTSPTSNGWDR